MSEILKNIISFFKTRLVTVKLTPSIEVSYHSYDDEISLALADEWKKLRVEIDKNPSCIKKQNWNDYSRDGIRTETLTVDIDGVVMKLRGPYEPNPNFMKPPPEPIKSEEQRANEAIDQLISSTSMIWAIVHCSDRKHHAFIEFLNADRQASNRFVG